MKVFYRENGPKNAPVLLLLHGFPTSSHMFRNLIPLLADRYRVIAPDYPGYRQSDEPEHQVFLHCDEEDAACASIWTATISNSCESRAGTETDVAGDLHLLKVNHTATDMNEDGRLGRSEISGYADFTAADKSGDGDLQ